jgi:uncharacterized protein YijF (DUF1287 family)
LKLPLTLIFLPLALTAAPPREFLDAARKQIGVTVQYDPAYTVVTYPGGDVPVERGVCTDVVIRAMRGVGIDLQREVHDDMKRAFSAYPQMWGLRRPDPNIDHRRVPNLMRLFERRGKKLPVSDQAIDYRAGDFVTCLVPPNLPHIMIVSDHASAAEPARPLVIHNIGAGAREEDRLFEFKLTGHYRWWQE